VSIDVRGAEAAEFIAFQSALSGRYFLEGELGRGGMGIVYRARDVALDRLVALKLLPPRLADDPGVRDRFLREARLAAKLSHPHIVPIFAVEEVGDFVYFAMAFIEGTTLGDRIRTRGPVPPSDTCRIVREVAWGLAYAHSQGVVHRDVKADNILLERASGRALIADFGIARVTQATGTTGAGEILGTAEYMSPEQASGEPVDRRSDIYSLGIVAFYALTGRLPFEGPSVGAILARQITQPAPPVARAADGIPSKLASAVDRCLEKDPARRFQTAEDLADGVGAAIEARRELPVPLRVFLRKTRETGRATPGVVVFSVFMGMAVVGEALSGGPAAAVGGGFALLMGLPVVALTFQCRSLIKAGYGREDLLTALKAELEREQEERAFEWGRGVTHAERVMRWLGMGGFAAAAVGAVLPSNVTSASLVALGLTVGTLGAVGGIAGHGRRTNLVGRWLAGFWRSRAGRWCFSLAKATVFHPRTLPQATHRPTELAIGMAVDALFESLPKLVRRDLGDLPKVVRGLEADAMRMRRRVADLTEAVARNNDDGIRDALDGARNRLVDSVTALESIRLNLLRLTAGAGSVESLTADLASAREIGEQVERLLEGQRDVDALLREGEPRVR
jgi:serine/threonine-protein kinase